MKQRSQKLKLKYLTVVVVTLFLTFLYQNCGNGFRVLSPSSDNEFSVGQVTAATPESTSQVFLNQPSTKSVFAGDSLLLQPLMQIESDMTFQWFKDNVAIVDATSFKLYISSSSEGDAGSYVLKTTKSGQTVASPPVQVKVMPATGPVPPTADMTASSETVIEGQDLSVKVNATGSPTPTYSWRVEGARALFTLDLKTDTLLLKGLVRTTDGPYPATFRVIANIQNTVESKDIIKEFKILEAAPTFSHPLTEKVVLAGDVVTLCVLANSALYKWSKDGSPLENKTGCLLIYPASLADSGVYKVTATNTGGSTSSEARLTVGNTPVVKPLQDVTTDSSNQSAWCVQTSSHEMVQEANGATLTSLALPTLTYQWSKDGVKLPAQTKRCLTGAGTELAPSDSGRYQVDVSNGSGTASTSANLVVIPKNEIVLVKGLSDKAITWAEWKSQTGDEAFCVKAIGVTRYFWFKDGVPLPFESGKCLQLSGLTKTLTAQSGRYTVKMIQGFENAPTATLESSATFDFTKTIQPIANNSLFMVDEVRLEGMGIRKILTGATSEQLVGATITWYKDGQIAKYNNGTTMYFIEKAEMSDAGQYEVRIRTALGQTVSASANIVIVSDVAPPYIYGLAGSNPNYFPDGSRLTNCAYAVGTGPLTYQWKKNGVPIEGQTRFCLDFPSTYNADLSGLYEVTVSNSFGSSSSSFKAP